MMNNLLLIERPISTNKNVCLQIDWSKPSVFGFGELAPMSFVLMFLYSSYWFQLSCSLFFELIAIEISLTRKRDHAGFIFNLNFFYLNFYFNIYDSRHWDDEDNKWEEYYD